MPTDAQLDAALLAWRNCFNSGAYFEAHETLEAAWLAADEPDRSFLKGLIHAAVALCHYQRGNGHGARAKYASCRAVPVALPPALPVRQRGGSAPADRSPSLGRFWSVRPAPRRQCPRDPGPP